MVYKERLAHCKVQYCLILVIQTCTEFSTYRYPNRLICYIS